MNIPDPTFSIHESVLVYAQGGGVYMGAISLAKYTKENGWTYQINALNGQFRPDELIKKS